MNSEDKSKENFERGTKLLQKQKENLFDNMFLTRPKRRRPADPYDFRNTTSCHNFEPFGAKND